MLDYFNLPPDFPGKSRLPSGSGKQRVEYLEEEFKDDIGAEARRFLPHLSCHEFEALLFASPEAIARQFPKVAGLQSRLERVRRRFASPEEINDREPPSRKITALVPQYQKRRDGIQIASAIGLDRIRAACPHFDQWVDRLAQIGRSA